MDLEELFKKIDEFCAEKHGSSDLHSESIFVRGRSEGKYAPLKWVLKKYPEIKDGNELLRSGFILEAYSMFSAQDFKDSYENLFQRKLPKERISKFLFYTFPDNKGVFNTIETIHNCFEQLRNKHIILNGKNLPTQIGEWYARCIFGLEQLKSASQRGFDFKLDGEQVEVKVHWSDTSSPKGVKIRKTQVSLSKHLILIYLGRNFMIRELCYLDSDFILRKFSTKGHTVFLKDNDLSSYFYSKSSKHDDKVKNPTALLKFSNPKFVLKIADRFH